MVYKKKGLASPNFFSKRKYTFLINNCFCDNHFDSLLSDLALNSCSFVKTTFDCPNNVLGSSSSSRYLNYFL